MQYVTMNSITDVVEGIIAQQVNCQNRIGAGVSCAIIRKYPEVERLYHAHCMQYAADERDLLGSILMVHSKYNTNLKIANLFSQRYYGNAKKTGQTYTDETILIKSLIVLCKRHPHTKVYIPEYIGCGLAGGNWTYVCEQLEQHGLQNLYVVCRHGQP